MPGRRTTSISAEIGVDETNMPELFAHKYKLLPLPSMDLEMEICAEQPPSPPLSTALPHVLPKLKSEGQKHAQLVSQIYTSRSPVQGNEANKSSTRLARGPFKNSKQKLQMLIASRQEPHTIQPLLFALIARPSTRPVSQDLSMCAESTVNTKRAPNQASTMVNQKRSVENVPPIATGNHYESAFKNALPKMPAFPRGRQIGLSKSTKSLYGRSFVSPLKRNWATTSGNMSSPVPI